ncbi:MAG: hypothetical protein JWN25_769 [Verrucomicrobiales bacterium]|jgi:cytochrome c5|nr:hypothetical protein [Verrucomicrobiales bacterium]
MNKPFYHALLGRMILLSAALLAFFDVQPCFSQPFGTDPAQAKPNPLVWDNMTKEAKTQPGDQTHLFSFSVTNTSDHAATITHMQPSCGCTVAEMPETPWVIKPGSNGTVKITINLVGKIGIVTKTISVDSSEGPQMLMIRVDVPPDDSGDRLARRMQNQQLALMDRQAVFRNDCADCHVKKSIGQTGEALYQTSCGICHTSEHRASIVPDLVKMNHPTDKAFWKQMIAEGKDKTLMPGFGKEKGGPLTAEQIDSLVEYASAHLNQAAPTAK